MVLRDNSVDEIKDRSVHVSVRLDENCVRRWHVLLLERIMALPGVRVSARVGPAASTLPSGMNTLFQLETAIYGLGGPGLAERVPLSHLTRFLDDGDDASVDLVMDLCGDAPSSHARVWRLTYNGGAGEDMLLSAIMDGQTPIARISENGTVIAAGRLGTEYGGVVLASFQDCLARTATLIASAISSEGRTAGSDFPDLQDERPKGLSNGRLTVLGARKLAGQVVRQIYRLCYRTPHWRVGWRAYDGSDVFDLRSHPAGGWNDLADDGKRFYADPFPILHQGQVTLFVEEYIHRLGKGIISAVGFGPSGPLGTPVPVLELDCHLSYPFVFEREGQFWMIPESCQNGTVALFRATAFPGGWVKEATLLSDTVASDATLVEKDGVWWMLATVRDGGGAFSDALHIWSAPDFRGPWTAHRNNPVMIDIESARPAGRMVWRGGSLLRPVQDCRKGYGAALGIARVSQLDSSGFAQTVETVLTPGSLWPGRRLHTLNHAGGLEFIDGSGHAPRWKRSAQTAASETMS